MAHFILGFLSFLFFFEDLHRRHESVIHFLQELRMWMYIYIFWGLNIWLWGLRSFGVRSECWRDAETTWQQSVWDCVLPVAAPVRTCQPHKHGQVLVFLYFFLFHKPTTRASMVPLCFMQCVTSHHRTLWILKIITICDTMCECISKKKISLAMNLLQKHGACHWSKYQTYNHGLVGQVYAIETPFAAWLQSCADWLTLLKHACDWSARWCY